MGEGKLQDIRSIHKSQLYFYILWISNLRIKLRKYLFIKTSKEIKCFGINLTKTCKTLTLKPKKLCWKRWGKSK